MLSDSSEDEKSSLNRELFSYPLCTIKRAKVDV